MRFEEIDSISIGRPDNECKMKIGTGVGSQHLFFKNEYGDFFNDIDDFFFFKKDLINYMYDAKEEFFNPSEDYHFVRVTKKADKAKGITSPTISIRIDLKKYWKDLMQEVNNLDEICYLGFVRGMDNDDAGRFYYHNESANSPYGLLYRMCIPTRQARTIDKYRSIYKLVKIHDTLNNKKYIHIIPIFNMTYSIEQLSDFLKRDYPIDVKKQKSFMFDFFFKYADLIKRQDYSIEDIINKAAISISYLDELETAVVAFSEKISDTKSIYRLFADSIRIYDDGSLSLKLNNEPLQQIFYGAPGTGKSHEIKEKTKGQSVIRTTFHPDSDYSTFVGCYKPTMSDPKPIYGFDATGKTVKVEDPKGEIIGEQKIEYKFVKQAFLKAYLGAWKKMANYKPIDRVFSVSGTKYDIIGISDDLVRVKLSDSDDSTEIEIKKSELEKICKTKDSHDEEGQMPQELGSDKPNEEQKNPNNQGDVNKIKEGLGERLKEINNSFDIAWSTLEKGFLDPQFLIIEEINRGNCAQIFGDVFQLLDRGGNRFSEYPIEADTDLQKEIENAFKNEKEYKLDCDINVDGVVKNYVSNYENGTLSKDIQAGRILLLPPNLYIWATMNTSDQSLFPMDSAFKRRWDWECIPIDYENEKSKTFNITINGVEYNWHDFLKVVNKKILDATGSEDKQMGNFFIKGDVDEKQFINKVMFYLWNDVCKEEYGTNNNFFRYYKDSEKKETEPFTFNKLFESDAKDTLNNFMVYMEDELAKIKKPEDGIV